MALVFAVVLFISSTLLFLVEPMVARMLLPTLGGAPAVWNTCMVFFQCMLFAGYLYAHATTRWLQPRAQATVHAALWTLSIAVLPIAIPADATPRVGSPILWLLTMLFRSIGLPFFLLATSSPILQQWLTSLRRDRTADPYVLYAAGNAGSLIALLAYPLVLEPRLRLGLQSTLWAMGYMSLAVLIVICGVAMMLAASRRAASSSREGPPSAADSDDPSVTFADRARWVALAGIPSSLVLAVTTYLTTEIAAVPMLWVVPLALYLLTFVLAFGVRSVTWNPVVADLFAMVCLPMAVLIGLKTDIPSGAQVAAHLFMFFLAAMVCHGELWRRRPGPSHLTEFYVWLSLGGLVGGLITALVAPVAFTSITEYPLALVLACAVRPVRLRSVRFRTPDFPPTENRKPNPGFQASTPLSRRILDVSLPAALGLAIFACCHFFAYGIIGLVHLIVVFPVLILYRWSSRPWRFALGVAALLISLRSYSNGMEHVVYRGRSFFGAHHVLMTEAGDQRLLVHGATVHGAQSVDPARRGEPLAYYSRSGPIGQLFEAFSGPRAKERVGIVGLGVGALAAYSEQRQHWTFFEIDPAIERVARDARYFTYLADARADVRVVLGDARISLGRGPRAFDLLVLDAFSGDAIPVHLMTREALQLYLKTLDDEGVLAFHISNRYFDLRPALGALARDAGLVCIVEDDVDVAREARATGKFPSRWVLMARHRPDLEPLLHDPRWRPLSSEMSVKVWTDDFSNLLSLMNWHVS